MDLRSVYGLYNTISLGVAGTPMRPFAEFSDADRWDLAFFVAALRTAPEVREQGQALWQQGQAKSEFTDMKALVTALSATLMAEHGANLRKIPAYLIAHPSALQATAPAPPDLTRNKLQQALQQYRRGDRTGARQLAIGAYLEGFELGEVALDSVNASLRVETEREMVALRTAIGAGQPIGQVAQKIDHIDSLLARAEEKLSTGNLSPLTAFVSALLILLREGLEALLVLAAIVAFVVKTGRRGALPYILVGWISALVLGALTWVAANYLLTISGANREVTEGVMAQIAAAMLLYVRYWLHNKSYAQAWQHLIREQVTTALGKRTLWATTGISFLAVYRELFEIILFYQTLWVQVGADGHLSVIGGRATAALLLALLGWLILKYSVRLPIGLFFSAISVLLAMMAVVFTGNGVAALQEAALIDSTLVYFISLPLLVIHPTAQGLSAQLLVLILVTVGILISRREGLAHRPVPAQPLQLTPTSDH